MGLLGRLKCIYLQNVTERPAVISVLLYYIYFTYVFGFVGCGPEGLLAVSVLSSEVCS